MPSTISAGTTAGTAIAIAGDTTGNLAFQTNGTTTAMTIDTSQNVAVGTTTALATASGRGNITINGSSGSILSFGTGGSLRSYIFQDPTTMYVTNSSTGPINFEVNGVQGMRIDSAGRVTTPFQPSASVGRTSPAWTTLDTVIWNVVHSNTGNHYNASNGTFTCPVAGDYLVSMMVMSNDQNVTMDIELRRNGTTAQQLVPYQAETGGSYNQVSGLTVITCAANDALTIRLNSGSIFAGGSGRHSSVVFRLIG